MTTPTPRAGYDATVDIDTQLRHVETRLVREFGPAVSAESVHECVRSAIEDLGGVHVRHFVPILVERIARGRIRSLP
jgi:hypothetical protein